MPAKIQPQQKRHPKASQPKASQPVWDQDSDDSPWEDVVPQVTAQQRQARVVLRYTRVMRKLLWAVAVGAMTRVLRSWQRQTLADDPQETQIQDQPSSKKAAAKKKPRRDDLSYIGAPMPPTSRAFPLNRNRCNHLNDQNVSLLQANGGRAGAKLIYWWTCSGCGSRWKRINQEEYCFGPETSTSATSSTGPIRPSVAVPKAPAPQPARRIPVVQAPQPPRGSQDPKPPVISLLDDDAVTEIQTDEEMADPGLHHQ